MIVLFVAGYMEMADVTLTASSVMTQSLDNLMDGAIATYMSTNVEMNPWILITAPQPITVKQVTVLQAGKAPSTGVKIMVKINVKIRW